MNEMTPRLPQELEQALVEYYSAPAPSEIFASRLEAQLRRKVGQPQRKPGITERISLMKLIRPHPLRALLLALLILLILSGVAYALGKALGFIPGIGMVEQATTLRTIESPVPMEREEIRVTIMNVIANPSSTSIRFQVEWLRQPSSTGDFDTSCQGTPSFILSDGTSLHLVETKEKFMVGETGSNMGYGYVMEFAPIPADQSDVTFLYPCINPFVPGPLPRDWQIPIHLFPAPGGMALPVIAVPATETPIIPATEAPATSNPTPLTVDLTHQITLSVDSFVPMDDGYLLIGSMQWSANDYPAYGVKPIAFTGYVNVVDANGQEIFWEEVYGNVKPHNEEYRSYWAIKVLSKTFAPPLKITMNAADVQIQPIPFRFDVGSAPQAGQSWDLNQDLRITDSLARVVKANLISSDGNLNFQLEVQVDANVIGDLYMSTPLNQCTGGGGGYPTEHLNTLQIYVPMCRPDLPPGIVEMQATGAVLWGEWQINWEP